MEKNSKKIKSKTGLQGIFSQFRWQILLTWTLVLLEGSIWVVMPAVLGKAIDSVLIGEWDGVILLTAVLVVGVIIGTARRLYDTRVYAHIYTRVATNTVKRQQQSNSSLSVTVTRSQLVKELIDFFEFELTEGFIAVVLLLGALIMLPFYEMRVFISCLIGTLLIILIYKFSEGRIFKYNHELNNELKNQVNVIENFPLTGIFRFYRRMASWRIRLSDLESFNYFLVDIIIIVLLLLSVFFAAQAQDATAGSIFAVVTYVTNYAEGVFMLPLIFQQYVRLKEISQRLDNEQTINEVNK
jgi:hypothetical protein